MYLGRFSRTNRKSEADQSSMTTDRTPPHTSNVMTASSHSGRDSVRQPGSSLTDRLENSDSVVGPVGKNMEIAKYVSDRS